MPFGKTIKLSTEYWVDDLVEEPRERTLVLLDAAADPSPRRLLIVRPEWDRLVSELVVRVQRLNVWPPSWLALEVSVLPLMLEEEPLVTE